MEWIHDPDVGDKSLYCDGELAELDQDTDMIL